MKKIQLGGHRYKNKPIKEYALVDNLDFEYLNQWKWSCSTSGYALRNQYLGGGRKNQKRKTIFMHHLIINTPKSKYTDHVNGNPLDNRRKNLRIATKSQNGINRGKQVNNTSGFKGVNFIRKKWRTRISIGNSKRKHIGYFDTIHIAAMVYDLWTKDLHGKFAKTNFIY